MKDEIKEILDYLEGIVNEKYAMPNEQELLNEEEIKILLDYITNLQERNKKAIEYTKQFINGKTSRIDEWKNVELVLETIIQLLQGEDKDEQR